MCGEDRGSCSSRSWSTAQSDRSSDLQEYRYHRWIGRRRTLMRNEERLAQARCLQPVGEIPIQREPRRWMERQQPALLELGLGND